MKEICDICDICSKNKSVANAVLKIYSANGWEEKVVPVCKECMIEEELVPIKEVKKEKAA